MCENKDHSIMCIISAIALKHATFQLHCMLQVQSCMELSIHLWNL